MTEHIFNGCRREVMLSVENAFQLDSRDNASRHKVSRLFASHQQNYMGAVDGKPPKPWLWSVYSGWVRGSTVTDCFRDVVPEDGG
jgi:hypothetical protein